MRPLSRSILGMLAAVAAGAIGAPGCIEELDPRSIVKTPRILAIVADRPEAAPGEDVRLEALLVDPEGRALTLSWTACMGIGEFRTGNAGAQYGSVPEREGCVEGAPDVFPLLADGAAGVIPGLLTEIAFENLETLARAFGEDLGAEVLRFIVETSGLPLTVDLAVRAGDEELVRGFKRVLVSIREEPGTNPPPPRFQVGGEWVTARGVEEPFACVPESGIVPTVAVSSRVVLAPDPDDEAWLETYLVVDVTGEVVEREENAYYSWYGTDGTFQEEVTRAPVREEIWKAPRTPGRYPLWLVVRDGHGGTSACRAEVDVVARP